MERLAQTLHEVDMLTREERYDEALARLEASYRAHTGSGREMVGRLTRGDLVALLSSAGTLDVEKCLLTAELLEAEWRVRQAEGQPLPASHALKALDLYLAALTEEPELAPDYAPKVDALRAALEGYDLPADTQRRLFEYHARVGNFAEAENLLFDLLEDAADDDLVARGHDFYASLLTLSDDELGRGGLPRDEVAEGRAGLERLSRER